MADFEPNNIPHAEGETTDPHHMLTQHVGQRDSAFRATYEKGKTHARKGAKTTLTAVGLGLALVFAATFLERPDDRASSIVSQTTATGNTENVKSMWLKNVTQIDAPENITIFGERIPIENWDIRERFEREFYYNYQNADQLVIWYKRGHRYFDMIDRMLEDAGVPRDLKYLMVAESGVRNVQSPANANGFWQFIPGTATRYGLRVDQYVDERLDPRKSTKAAIRYLSDMKSKVPDWTMVAAGYNMGEGNVRDVRATQKQESYFNWYVNEETMRYVYRIAAIKELMEHGSKYGLEFGRLKAFELPDTKVVKVNGPIAQINDWALAQGYTYKDVKVLNPWIVGRSLPAGNWEIELPQDDDDRTTVRKE
jgi:membrane-bound lytic murein transglycosylase D